VQTVVSSPPKATSSHPDDIDSDGGADLNEPTFVRAGEALIAAPSWKSSTDNPSWTVPGWLGASRRLAFSVFQGRGSGRGLDPCRRLVKRVQIVGYDRGDVDLRSNVNRHGSGR